MSTSLSAPVSSFQERTQSHHHKSEISFVRERSCNSRSEYNEHCTFACTVEKLYDFGLEPAKSRCERF